MSTPTRFNVRVYFLLLNETEDSVLVSDEIIRKKQYTKFPGGGLEFGEGTVDCVLREAIEELGQEVEVISHFYTTDFFIQSAFREEDQVISIYYNVRLKDKPLFRISSEIHNFLQHENNEESFRWASLNGLQVDDFSFPADRAVAAKLIALYSA
jgi:8-oxo-dGTP pyrophosphatase MutT (NUDIX family)